MSVDYTIRSTLSCQFNAETISLIIKRGFARGVIYYDDGGPHSSRIATVDEAIQTILKPVDGSHCIYFALEQCGTYIFFEPQTANLLKYSVSF